MAKVARPPGAWSILKESAKVRAWHEARSLRSQLSADNDARKLRLLLERIELNPETVVQMASKNPDRLREILVRYAARLKKAGKLDSTIVKSLGGLRNYLAYRHVSFDGYPKLEPIQAASLSLERVPTPEELGGILERLTLRGRAIALLMAHSGLRPATIAGYSGDRGLTLGDLPDLELSPEPKFKELPFAIRVPGGLSKTRASYISFGTRQLAIVLLSSLLERREGGEKLSPASPLIAHTPPGSLRGAARREALDGTNRFMRTSSLTKELGEALHAAMPEGVTWRPYVLRSYCSTRLLLSQMNRDLRESLLGHDTGISGMYSVRKRWGPELLAEARRQYAEAAPFLETIGEKKASSTVDLKRAFLEIAGVPEGERAKYAGTSNEEFLKLLRELLLKSSVGPDVAPGMPGRPVAEVPAPRPGDNARTVDVSELDAWLSRGWRPIAPAGARFVVGAPS